MAQDLDAEVDHEGGETRSDWVRKAIRQRLQRLKRRRLRQAVQRVAN
jgi:metal-responsive CopG/Arc/MetJ family transcriptional regulator